MDKRTRKVNRSAFLLAFLLCGLVVLLTMAACSQPSAGEETAEEGTNPSNLQEKASENTDGESLSVKAPSEAQTFDDSASISQTTLVDNDVVTVIAEGISYSSNALNLKLRITNNYSESIEVLAGTAGFSANYINDYMTTGYLNCDIAPGETADESIKISIDELRLMGIQAVGEMGVGLYVKPDNEGKEAEDFIFDELFRDVLAVKTSLYDAPATIGDTYASAMENSSNGFTQLGGKVIKFTREEAFQQSGIAIDSMAIVENAEGDQFGLVEFENTTDDLVSVRYGDICFDGTLVYDGLWDSVTIAPGKRSVRTIEFKRILDWAKEIKQEGVGDLSGIDCGALSSFGMVISAVDENRNTLFEEAEIEYSF